MDPYSPERYVYHYTKTKILLDFILPDKALLLSPLSKTNDPREYKYKLFSMISNFLYTDAEYMAINDQINRIIGENCKVAAFCCDTNWPYQNIEFRGYMHPRMWAQYSENHSGVCIVFNRTRIEEAFNGLSSIGSIFSGEMSYYKRPSRNATRADYRVINEQELSPESLIQHINKYYRELFFQKNIDWQDEAEYRLLLLQKGTTESVYINLKETVAAVIIGSEYPESLIDPLLKYARSMYFSIGHLQWKYGDAYIGTTLYDPTDERGYPDRRAYFFTNIDFFQHE